MPGAGGHFLGSVLLSLCTPIELNNPLSGHENRETIGADHELLLCFRTDVPYDNTEINLLEEITRIKRYKFNEHSPRPFFVIPMHIIDPTPVLLAFENTKLINVKHDSSDLTQLVYNDVIKSPNFFTKTLPQCFADFKRLYPNKLVDLKLEDIKITDTKLMTYITKYVSIRFCEKFKDFSLTNVKHLYTIERADLNNKNLIHKLDDLAEFVGIKLLPERRQNAIDLIKKYAEAQIMCPWNLYLSDYE
jgi:hypothetical protein